MNVFHTISIDSFSKTPFLAFFSRELLRIYISWEDKHFFSFILDKVLAINNKRNQLKIKEIKVYSSKQLMTSCGNIKTKMYKRGSLATL